MTAVPQGSPADARHALAVRPMTAIQIRTVGICALINLIDGFDVMAIAYAASHIGREWQLSPTELGLLFSAGLAGMTVSSLFLAPVADYIGRRRAILLFLLVVCIAMAGSALAENAVTLAGWRFLTGIGVGGLLPGINTMVAEYASEKRRELSVSIMQAGFPLGASVGGIAALFLIEASGWRAVFWVGTGLSTVMLFVAWKYVPESIEYLLSRPEKSKSSQINKILASLDINPIETNQDNDSIQRQVGIRALASRALIARVSMLSACFLCVMASFYFVSAWTPKLLIDAGLSVASGITGGILLNLGGVIGGIVLAWMISGPRIRLFTLCYMLISAAGMAIYGTLTTLPVLLLMAGVLGFFLVGTMIGLYSLTPALFPPGARATATGIAIGMGRFGAMAGPVVTGVLLEWGLTTASIYIVFAIPLVVAALAMRLLHHLANQGDPA